MAFKKSHATEVDEATSEAIEVEAMASIVVEVHSEVMDTAVDEDEAVLMAHEVVAVPKNHKPRIPDLSSLRPSRRRISSVLHM